MALSTDEKRKFHNWLDAMTTMSEAVHKNETELALAELDKNYPTVSIKALSHQRKALEAAGEAHCCRVVSSMLTCNGISY